TAHFLQGGVEENATLQAAFDTAERLGSLGLVVNCAGAGVFGPAGSHNRDDFYEVLGGNLIGLVLFSEVAFLKLKSRGGTIVNVMSTAAMLARQNEALYCASKWGARGYTESLSLEAKGTPVKVISVYPGGMRTRFWTKARGAKVDANTFMDAREVAEIVVEAIRQRHSSYISDIVINRGS